MPLAQRPRARITYAEFLPVINDENAHGFRVAWACECGHFDFGIVGETGACPGCLHEVRIPDPSESEARR